MDRPAGRTPPRTAVRAPPLPCGTHGARGPRSGSAPWEEALCRGALQGRPVCLSTNGAPQVTAQRRMAPRSHTFSNPSFPVKPAQVTEGPLAGFPGTEGRITSKRTSERLPLGKSTHGIFFFKISGTRVPPHPWFCFSWLRFPAVDLSLKRWTENSASRHLVTWTGPSQHHVKGEQRSRHSERERDPRYLIAVDSVLLLLLIILI